MCDPLAFVDFLPLVHISFTSKALIFSLELNELKLQSRDFSQHIHINSLRAFIRGFRRYDCCTCPLDAYRSLGSYIYPPYQDLPLSLP